jgi:pimeloyl-ACP methyl ester carboxylesterase
MTLEAAPPLAAVAALERRARRHATACGEGMMVWRVWGDGPPVVLLHGGYGSWTHWLRNIDPLAQRRRVIVPDLPGLGDSAAPPPGATAEENATIVAAGLDMLLRPGERYVLVGFSFGALMTAPIAAAAGARLELLVLVGSTAWGLSRAPQGSGLERMSRRMSTDEIAAVQRANLGRLMLHDTTKIDDFAVRLQADNVMRARFRSIGSTTPDWLVRWLPAIAAPVAAIWGAHDVTSQPVADRVAALRRHKPEAVTEIVPGAGHWVQYEASDAFNRFLADRIENGTMP